VRGVLVAVSAALVLAAPSAAAAPTIPVLWSIRDDGAQRTAVTTLPVDGLILARAPTGRLAVDTGDGLVLENSDGGDQTLVPETQSVQAAVFSPSGSSVLFSLGDYGSSPASWVLAVAPASGAGFRVVAVDAALGSWSHDGRTIVYPGRIVGDQATVLAVPAAGGTATLLASGASFDTDDDSTPELSPDGRSVAYVCGNTGGGTLCVTRGGTTRRYPHGGWQPLWSPNGRYLATQLFGNYNSGAGLVDTVKRTRSVIAMPQDIGVEYQVLAWSPDSTRLLYERQCDAGLFIPSPCRFDTWVRTIASRRDRRVSVDGVTWSLAEWRGRTITYVTG